MRVMMALANYDWVDPPEEPPIEGAVLGLWDVWDFRVSASPQEFDEKVGALRPSVKPWLEEGSRHGTWTQQNGLPGIVRLRGQEKMWFIELADMGELLTFVKKHGPFEISMNRSGQLQARLGVY